MKEVAKKSWDAIIIACMIAVALTVLVQFGFRPQGQLFGVVFYIALAILVVMMIVKIIVNWKPITREKVPFLVVNIVALVIVVIAMWGLKFNHFEGRTFATIVHYAALATYFFTSLCLL